MSTLDLTGLPVNDAVSLARRKLDCEFAREIAEFQIELICRGVSPRDIEGLLEHERAGFVTWRREHLAELRAWILDCNRRLH